MITTDEIVVLNLTAIKFSAESDIPQLECFDDSMVVDTGKPFDRFHMFTRAVIIRPLLRGSVHDLFVYGQKIEHIAVEFTNFDDPNVAELLEKAEQYAMDMIRMVTEHGGHVFK